MTAVEKISINIEVDTNKARKDLNSFSDDIKSAQNRLKSDRGIVLASNLAELRIKAKELSDELKKTTSNERRLDLQTNIELVKKQITDANRQFTNFIRTGDEAQSVLGKNFASIDKSVNNTKGVFGNLTGSIKTGFADIVKGLGVFTLIQRAVDFMVQGVQTGIQDALQLEGLNSSLQRLSYNVGETAENIKNRLREVSQGTVSDIDLIKSANKALALGVGSNADDIATLLEIARLKSKSFGTTTTEAFNDIVTGLGRSSPLILDNLGITIKLGEAQEMYAASIGKTVTQLTDAEKKQALINAVVSQGKKELEQAGDQALTTSERRSQLKTTFSNFFAEVGQYLIFSGLKVAARYELWAISVEGAYISFNRFVVGVQIGINKTVAFLSGVVGAFKAVGSNIGSAFGQGITGVIQLAINGVIGIVERGVNSLLGSVRTISSLLSKIPGMEKTFGGLNNISLGRVDLGASFDFKDVGAEFSKSFASGINLGLKDSLKGFDLLAGEVQDRFDKAFLDQKGIKLGGPTQGGFGSIIPGLNDTATGSGSKGGSGKSKAVEEQERLKKLEEERFNMIQDKGKKAFDGLTDTIKKSVDEVTKLQDKLKGVENELAGIDQSIANRILTIEENLKTAEGDKRLKLEEELALAKANIDEAILQTARDEAAKSETQKLLDKKLKLEEEMVVIQEKIDYELQAQKDLTDAKMRLEEMLTEKYQVELKKREDLLAQSIDRQIALATRIPSLSGGSSGTTSKINNTKNISINANINNSTDADSLFRKISQ